MVSAFFYNFFLFTLSLFVRFLVFHSTIVSYVLFALSCTIKSVQLFVQCIMIIFLHQHKYSAPPATPIKLVAATASFLPPHFKIQWWCYQAGARYCQSLHLTPATFGPSGPSGPFGLSGPSVPSIQ